MALVLISALFIPGVMAQENEKEFVKEIPQVVNGKTLMDIDENRIEDLVYYFLNGEGAKIKNLDLSQLKIAESNDTFEFSGIILYVDENNKSCSTEIYSSFDFANSSIQLFSKSGNNYYEMYASLSNAGDFIIKETSVVNGLVYNNIDTISSSSKTTVNELSTPQRASAEWVYVDFPSMLSYVPGLTQTHNDIKLSDILTATSIASGIGGLGVGVVITAAGILAGALWTVESGADPSNTYVDVFKIPYGAVLSILNRIIGTIAGSMYMEIDYCWVYK